MECRLTDQVYDYVVGNIRDGKFCSGMRLVQRDLARQLRISQAPVREALEKLVQKGWAVHRNRPSGVYIKDYSSQNDLSQLFEVRRALEVEAVRLLASRIRDQELSELADIHQELILADQEEDRSRYKDADVVFHRYIVSRCGNTLLADMFEPIMQQNYCYKEQSELMDLLFHALRPIESVFGRSHQPILDALKNRNPEEAEKAIRQHIQKLTPEELAQELKTMRNKQE